MESKVIIKEIVSYMEDHLSEELTLDKIAEQCNYSKFYVARVFKEETGCTLHKYLQSRRLTEAAYRLVNTDQPITEIAYGACYATQQAFTEAFRKQYLCTPQVYRRRKRFAPRQRELRMCADIYPVSNITMQIKGRMAA